MFCGNNCRWKKEVKYDFNYRLAHLLLWNEEKEAGVVW